MTLTNSMKRLRVQQLDRRFRDLSFPQTPPAGWIRTTRQTLNMTTAQLASRLGIVQQSVVKLEQAEADESITLARLRRAAEALGCRLVYALVPNDGSLDAMLKRRAHVAAERLVDRVEQTMRLEDQERTAEARAADVAELETELYRSLSRELWEES